MNSKEIERLYFQWVDIYKGLGCNYSDASYSFRVRRIVNQLAYLLGLC